MARPRKQSDSAWNAIKRAIRERARLKASYDVDATSKKYKQFKFRELGKQIKAAKASTYKRRKGESKQHFEARRAAGVKEAVRKLNVVAGPTKTSKQRRNRLMQEQMRVAQSNASVVTRFGSGLEASARVKAFYVVTAAAAKGASVEGRNEAIMKAFGNGRYSLDEIFEAVSNTQRYQDVLSDMLKIHEQLGADGKYEGDYGDTVSANRRENLAVRYEETTSFSSMEEVFADQAAVDRSVIEALEAGDGHAVKKARKSNRSKKFRK